MATDVLRHEAIFEYPRRYPRYKLELPVRVIARRVHKTSIVQGRGNELNEGGMAVFAGIELSVDEEIAVEFTPPYSGDPIRVRCVVRNRTGYNYGLEFIADTHDDRAAVGQIRSVLRGLGSPIK